MLLGQRAFETYRDSGVGGLVYAERACEGGVSGKMGELGWISFRGSAVDNADWHWLAGKTSAMIKR